MSLQDLLKASLESDMNEEMHELVEDGFDAEGALMMEHPAGDELDDIDEEMEVLDLIDSMEMIADTIQHVLTRNEQNASTAAMVQMSIERLYAHQGMKSPMASMEAYSDLRQYHVDSMEGLRETAAKLKARVAESVKNRIDSLAYKFKSEDNKIIQAQGRLEKALSNYNAKKDKLSGNMVIKFDSLGRFMTTDKGVVKDLYSAVEQDFQITEYLIHEYAKSHNTVFSKIASVVRNAELHDDKAIDAIISKLHSIKHPAKQIPTKFVSGYPLLGRAGVNVTTSKGSQENHELGELAQFYTTEIRKDPGALKDAAKEMGRDFALVMAMGSIGASYASDIHDKKYSATMKGGDLDRMVVSMKKHLGRLKDARKNIDQLADAQKTALEALTTMKPSANISKEKAAKLAHVGRCIEMLFRNGYRGAEAGLEHALYVVGAITYILEAMVRRAK